MIAGKEKLEDVTYEGLIDYLAGQAIMSLGQGKSIRQIVAENVHLTNMWTWAIAKKNEEQEKKK